MSNGQLRALSISCMVSNRTRCNQNCKFCISRITPGNGEQRSDGSLRTCSLKRWQVGLQFADRLQATHAILTGKADPTQEDGDDLGALVQEAHNHLPCVDMHTNGVLLQPGKKQAGLLRELDRAGLTMLTLSMASFDRKVNDKIMGGGQDADWLIEHALEHELQVRCSLVVNKAGVADTKRVLDYVMEAGRRGVHSVVVREVWCPETYGEIDNEVFQWNHDNLVEIRPLEAGFPLMAELHGVKVDRLPDLPWGTKVFGVGGGCFPDPEHEVNVTFAICDEATEGDVIKSVVHRPNGHGYRSWTGTGSIFY